jgi:hypothetical protein
MFCDCDNFSDVLHYNRHKIDQSNINEFVKLCLHYDQWVGSKIDAKHFVLDMLISNFPHLESDINKYRILV